MTKLIVEPITLNQKKLDYFFYLKANPFKQKDLQILSFYLLVLLPFYASYALFYNSFELRGMALHLSVVPIAVFFTVIYIYFYYWKEKKPSMIELSIKDEYLSLLSNDTILEEIALKNLEVKNIAWGPDICKLLPAIRLKSKGFNCTIGLALSHQIFKDKKQSIEQVDYIIEDEYEWNLLRNAL